MVLSALAGLAVVGLAVIALAVAAWVLVQRSGEVAALAERGRRMAGRVVERRARHSRGSAGRYRRVKLTYELPDGSRYAQAAPWLTLLVRPP